MFFLKKKTDYIRLAGIPWLIGRIYFMLSFVVLKFTSMFLSCLHNQSNAIAKIQGSRFLKKIF